MKFLLFSFILLLLFFSSGSSVVIGTAEDDIREIITCGKIKDNNNFSSSTNNISNIQLRFSPDYSSQYNQSHPCPLLEISDISVAGIYLYFTSHSVTNLIIRNVTAKFLYIQFKAPPTDSLSQFYHRRNLAQNDFVFDKLNIFRTTNDRAFTLVGAQCRSFIIKNSNITRNISYSELDLHETAQTAMYVTTIDVRDEFLFDNNYVFGPARAVLFDRVQLGVEGVHRVLNNIIRADSSNGAQSSATTSFQAFRLRVFFSSTYDSIFGNNDSSSTSLGESPPVVKLLVQNNSIAQTVHDISEYMGPFELIFESTNYSSSATTEQSSLKYFCDITCVSNYVSLDGSAIENLRGDYIVNVVAFDLRFIGLRNLQILDNSIYSRIMLRTRGFLLRMNFASKKKFPPQPRSDVSSSYVASGNSIELLTKTEGIDLTTLDRYMAASLVPEVTVFDVGAISGFFKIINISFNEIKRIQLYRPIGTEVSPAELVTQEVSVSSKLYGINLEPLRFKGSIEHLVVSDNFAAGEMISNQDFFVSVFSLLIFTQYMERAKFVDIRNLKITNNVMKLAGPTKIHVFSAFTLGDVDFSTLDSLVLKNNVIDASNASINTRCVLCDKFKTIPFVMSVPGIGDQIIRAEASIVSLASIQASGKDSPLSDTPIQISVENNTLVAVVAPATVVNPNPKMSFQLVVIGDSVGTRSQVVVVRENTMRVAPEASSSNGDDSSTATDQLFFAPGILISAIYLKLTSFEVSGNLIILDETADRVLPLLLEFSDATFVDQEESHVSVINNRIVSSLTPSNQQNNPRLVSYSKSDKFIFLGGTPTPQFIHIGGSEQLRLFPPTAMLLKSQKSLTTTLSSGRQQLQVLDNNISIAKKAEFRLTLFHNNSELTFSKTTIQGNDIHLSRPPNCTEDKNIVEIISDSTSSSSSSSRSTTFDISTSCNRVYFEGNDEPKRLDLSLLKKETKINIVDTGCEAPAKCVDGEPSSTHTLSLIDEFNNDKKTLNSNAIQVSSTVSAALTTTSAVQSLSMATMAVGASSTPALSFSIGRQQAMMNYALKAQQGDCRGLMPGTVSDSNEEEVDYSLPIADSPTQMKLGAQHPSSPAAPFYVGAVVGNFLLLLGIVSLNQLIGHIATKIIIEKFCPPSEYIKKKDLWKNYFYVFANSFVSLSLFYMIAILLSPTLTSAVSILAGTSNEVVSVGVKIACFLIAVLISSVGVYFVVWSTYIRKPRREIYRINKQEQEDEKKQKELGVMQLFKKLCKADGEWKIPLNKRTEEEFHAFQISEPCYESYRKNQWFAIVEIVIAILLCLPPLFAQLASTGKSSCIVQGVLLFLILLVYTILLLWKNPKKLKIMRFFVPAMAIQQTIVVGITLVLVFTSSDDGTEGRSGDVQDWLWKVVFAAMGFEALVAIISFISAIFPLLHFLKKLSFKIMQAKKAQRAEQQCREMDDSTKKRRNLRDLSHEGENDREMSLLSRMSSSNNNNNNDNDNNSNHNSHRQFSMCSHRNHSSRGRNDEHDRDDSYRRRTSNSRRYNHEDHSRKQRQKDDQRREPSSRDTDSSSHRHHRNSSSHHSSNRNDRPSSGSDRHYRRGHSTREVLSSSSSRPHNKKHL